MDHNCFRAFINHHDWTFAKTYAAFCPHEYIVMKRLPEEEHTLFPEIAQFIRDKGFVAKYGRLEPRSYYIVDDYYYWTMDEKVEDTDLINRAKLTDFDFVETAQGLTVRRHEEKSNS